MRVPDRHYGGYVFDLYGTVYLGDELLPGARETLEMPADYAAKLTRLPRRPSLLQTGRTT